MLVKNEYALWLVDLGMQTNFTPINIHAENENAFTWSCEQGHLEVAKWLVDLGSRTNFTPIDIHADNEMSL